MQIVEYMMNPAKKQYSSGFQNHLKQASENEKTQSSKLVETRWIEDWNFYEILIKANLSTALDRIKVWF